MTNKNENPSKQIHSHSDFVPNSQKIDIQKKLENFKVFRELEKKEFIEESNKRFENLRKTFEVEIKEIQIQQLEQEKSLQQKTIELKEKELVDFALILSTKNEEMTKINAEIISILEKQRPISALKKLLKNQEKQTSTKRDWSEFEKRFNKVHDDFLERLSLNFSKLSKRQLQICALLKTNLSSKEISDLLNISLRSVEQQRYKIRQKLNLTSEQNLTSFLVSI
ncbi:MAG: hypothetical protein DWQ06_13505 [Calditrichaeota bacterium]|nr:MAG: hypothetical protein DWQ06_13505 [Calditrichota bacterium]